MSSDFPFPVDSQGDALARLLGFGAPAHPAATAPAGLPSLSAPPWSPDDVGASPIPAPAPAGPIKGTPPPPSASVPAMEDVRRIRSGDDSSAVEGLRSRSGAAGDSRLLRPLLSGMREAPSGMGRFVGGAGDIVDMAGRARTAKMLDALFGPTESINRDPVADQIESGNKELAWEALQPIGAKSSIKFGIPGQTDMMSYEDDAGAAPLGTLRLGDLRSERTARLSGRGAMRPEDYRNFSQDKMRAYYVSELQKLRRDLDHDVSTKARTQEEADAEYRRAERNIGFEMDALSGKGTSGFFSRPLPELPPLE